MAILDALPGVVVSISAAGKELTEFEDHQENLQGPLAGKTVLRCLESVSGTEFAVNLTVSSSFVFDCPNIVFNVHVDGNFIVRKYFEPLKVSGSHWTRTVSGMYAVLPDGSSGLRKFKFNSIKTIDDADNLRIESDMVKASKIGHITIKVFRKGHSKKAKRHISDGNDAVMEIAEKAMKGKALSHSTAFQPAISSPGNKFVKADYLDGEDNPIGVFNFRYLSKEALQQELIIPHTPSPDPFDALTEAEKNRLARQMLAHLEASKVKTEFKSEKGIKREHDEDNSSNVSARRFKMIKTLDGHDAVDLTD